MTAPFVPPKESLEGYSQMTTLAERWRGECIQWFAELEQVVEDTLRVLATVPRRGTKVRSGEQVGCAFAQLRELTAAKGAFAKEGRAVATSIRDLSVMFEWRAHLTHGVRDVWRGKGSNWLLTFAHREPGGGPMRMHALPWSDAQEMLKRLEKEVAALRARCGSLRAAVRKS